VTLSWPDDAGEHRDAAGLSRAAIEMLAIICLSSTCHPRGRIEEIRGVIYFQGDAGRAAGNRLDPPARAAAKTPGRPLTPSEPRRAFFFCRSSVWKQLGDLPGLEELKGDGPSGFARLPSGFSVPHAFR